MKVLLNVLWIIFGGIFLSAYWAFIGCILYLTIIGIPFGIQCFRFANFMLFPFGREIVYSRNTVSLILNILWIILFGLNLSLWSLAIGFLWCVTIVGVPIGFQAIKFVKLSLMPFGAKIVLCGTQS